METPALLERLIRTLTKHYMPDSIPKIVLSSAVTLVALALLKQQKKGRKVEQSLFERRTFEQLLSELSTTFINLPEEQIDDNIGKGLGQVAELLKMDRITIFEISPKEAELRVTFSWRGERVQPAPTVINASRFPYWTKVLLRGEAVLTSDLNDLPAEASAEREYLRSIGVVSLATLPLKSGDDFFGCIALVSVNRQVFWSDDLVTQFRMLAEIFSNALLRKRAQETRFRYAAIVESSEDAIISKSLDGTILSWNAGAQRLFGFTEAEAIGQPNTILIPSELRDEEKVILQKLAAGERIEHFETLRVTKRGERVDVSLTISPIRDSAGKTIGASLIAHDITERKHAEYALRKSEEKFATAFRESPMALTLSNAKDQRYLDVNETFEKIAGYPREEVIGHSAAEIGLFIDPDQRMKLVQNLVAAGSIRNEEIRIRAKNGVELTCLTSAELIEIDGEPCVLATIADITDLRQAEQTLRESEERLAGIVASAMDAIIVVNDKQRIVLINRAAEKMFGCQEIDVIGKPIERFIPTVFRPEYSAYLRRFATSDDTRLITGALSGLRANGDTFPIEGSISHVVTKGKELFTLVIRDITERRRAEQALRESEGRFRLVANTAPVLIWMSGPNKLCTYFNQPWLDFTGRSIEAELGNGWAERVHPEDLQTCLKTYTKAFDRREPFKMNYRIQRHDGEYRWFFDIGVPRFNTDGSLAGYIGSCIDVTEQKLAQEALEELSGRLIEAQEAERSRIARELHDDICQKLAMLSLEIEHEMKASDGAPTRDSNRMNDIWQHCSDIAGDVQALSHELHSPMLDHLGMAAAVRNFCREFSLQHDVVVEFTDAEVPRSLPRDVSLCLFRVVQEALHNAVKHSGVNFFEVRLQGSPGKIEVEVRDEGVGCDMENLQSNGGLGLISMRERVHLVRGTFAVDSQINRGTKIRASVPLVANISVMPGIPEEVGAKRKVAI